MRINTRLLSYTFSAAMAVLLPGLSLKGQDLDSFMFQNSPRTSSISNVRVLNMTKDGEGYIWFGTNHGLFRYNGTVYKTYYSGLSDDEPTLSSDMILSLLPDSGGRMWVGTDGGINLIEKGVVTMEAPPGVNPIYSMVNLDSGSILYSTNEGLYVFDKESSLAKPVLQDENPDNMLGNITTMESTGENIWLNPLIPKSSLMVLDKDLNSAASISLDGNSLRGLAPYGGNMFVATLNGLKCYTSDGKEIPLPDKLQPFSSRPICGICSDKEAGTLTFGITDEGIYSFKGNSVKRIFSDEKLSGLPYCQILSGGTSLWINKFTLAECSAYHEDNDKTIELRNLRIGESIINVFPSQIRDKVIAVSSFDVYLVDILTKEVSAITPAAFPENRGILTSYMNSSGELFIYDNLFILHKFSKSEGWNYAEDYSVECGTFTASLWEDYSGNVCFIGDNTLFSVNSSGKLTRTVLQTPVSGLAHKGKDGRIYLVGNEGVFFVDFGMNFKKLPIEEPYMSCSYLDEMGRLYIGTARSVLLRYDTETGEMKNLSERLGPQGETIRSINSDGRGTIWVSSRNGIFRLDPDDGRATVYNYSSSQSMVFSPRCSALLEDDIKGNKVVFGCGQALAVVDPFIGEARKSHTLSIDAVFANNRQIREDDSPIVLNSNENQILIYYSGMDFGNSPTLSYSYMLEGYDKDWVFAGQNLTANYSRLPSGKFTFRLKAQTNDGEWTGDDIELNFRIKPSKWLSFPAIALYTLILLGLALYLVRLYSMAAKARKEALQASIDKTIAEKRGQDRMDTFTNISHELINPLSLIYGPAIDLQKEENLSPEGKGLLSLIVKNSSRMMRMTEQMMSFSRMEDSPEKLHISKTDIGKTVRTISENFSYMTGKKNLSLTLEIDDSLTGYCDMEKVAKVYTNLLSNAIKYTPRGGEITVSLASSDNQNEQRTAVLSVRDNGLGIPDEMKRKIFERFERVKANIGDGTIEGHGVGLNYAMQLSLIHKGSLTVGDNPPKGSVFTFTFPIGIEAYDEKDIISSDSSEDENTVIPEGAPTNTEEGKRSGTTILLVDDDPDILSYLKEVFREYKTRTAGNGTEALPVIRDNKVDIVVSDVMMPEMDGFTLCHEIKEDPDTCHIPVILLTAKGDSKAHVKANEAGADAFLQKPIVSDLLRSKVESILENRARLQKSLLDLTAGKDTSSKEKGLSTRDKDFLEKTRRITEENLSNEEFNATALAECLGISYTKFYYKMKGLLGITPQDFLLNYRMNRAMELLKDPSNNVSDVCYKVGFSSLSGFSRSFKNKFGVSPKNIIDR